MLVLSRRPGEALVIDPASNRRIVLLVGKIADKRASLSLNGLTMLKRQNERFTLQTGYGAVTVTLVEVQGGRVRLGFDGPAKLPIYREELTKASLV